MGFLKCVIGIVILDVWDKAAAQICSLSRSG